MERQVISVGTMVQVRTQEEFERLLALATSLSGWFNPATGYGEVMFAMPSDAVTARRAL